MERDKVIDKIRKLYRKSKGTDNLAEAKIFFEKVQELLLEHNISLHEIEKEEEKLNITYEESNKIQLQNLSNWKWQEDLAWVVSEISFTLGIFTQTVSKRQTVGVKKKFQYKNYVLFRGKKVNVEIAEYLYLMLRNNIIKYSEEYTDEVIQKENNLGQEYFLPLKELKKLLGNEYIKMTQNSYMHGFVAGLIHTLKNPTRKETESHKNKGNELLVLEKDNIRKYFEELENKKLKDRKAYNLSTPLLEDHFVKGKEQGKQQQLTKGLHENS